MRSSSSSFVDKKRKKWAAVSRLSCYVTRETPQEIPVRVTILRNRHGYLHVASINGLRIISVNVSYETKTSSEYPKIDIVRIIIRSFFCFLFFAEYC
jgi:hypothetical protein